METLTPNRTITIAGKDYVLDGSFGTLRTIQQTFNRDIVQILIGLETMSLDRVADLIGMASGQDPDVIGQDIIDSIGAMTKEYITLKTQLIAWLTIAIAGKDYVLDGSFGTLRTIQQTFNRDIVQILIGLETMSLDRVSDLIGIASGQDPDVIGQAIIDSIGAMTKEYITLKTQLIAWLTIAIAPKADREKKRTEMEAILAKLQPSPGESTANSVSEPSAGSPQNSGVPT